MSDDPYAFRTARNPGESQPVRARVKNDAGTDYNQAGLSTIVRELVMVDDGTVISTTSLVIANTVYDALQAWPTNGDAPDNDGFNFLDRFFAPSLAVYRGRPMEYRVTFTDTTGQVTILRGLVEVRAMP